jgi:hypothetical protein
MGLEFHRVGPSDGRAINKCMGQAQRSVVRLGDFGDQKCRVARPHGVAPNKDCVRHSMPPLDC